MAYTNDPTPLACPNCGHPLRRRQRTHYPETDRLKCPNCEYVRHLHLEEAEAVKHQAVIANIRKIASRKNRHYTLEIPT